MHSSVRARPPPARNAPSRFGKPRPPRQTEPQAPRLAIGNATRSSRASAEAPAKSNSRSCSSASPLVLVQKTAQLIQRMDHQLACRALEHPLQDVPHELPLCFRRRLACFINMGPLLFVSSDSSLDGHNLQKFQNCGVAEVLLFTQRFVDLSDRGRPALPEYSQDF